MKTRRIVITSLFAALCAIATVISVPSPISGYVNLGDGFVIISGFLLGPLYGGIAAGVGSALTDLILGYGVYIPATLIIKFLMAFVAGLIIKRKNTNFTRILSAVLAEIIMILGYFGYDALLLGSVLNSIAGIQGSIIQGVMGFIVSLILYPVLIKILNKNK